jgi:hypothetical protein
MRFLIVHSSSPSSHFLSLVSKKRNKYNYQKEDILNHGRVTGNKKPLILNIVQTTAGV